LENYSKKNEEVFTMNIKSLWLVGILVGVVSIGYFGYSTLGLNTDKMSEENKPAKMDTKETEAAMASSDAKVVEELMNKGDMASDFELMDTKGNVIKLSELKGQKVYVKFWASWCSICLAGLEEVDTLAAQSNGFKVITIVSPGSNGEQSKEDFITWFEGVEAKNLTVLLDVKGDVANAYGVRAYPTSSYIGTDGVLVKTQLGHSGNELIKEMMMEVK
jgi:peptide methionine sulfoxide reductase msrA/msrB